MVLSCRNPRRFVNTASSPGLSVASGATALGSVHRADTHSSSCYPLALLFSRNSASSGPATPRQRSASPPTSEHLANTDRATHRGLSTNASFRSNEEPPGQEDLHASTGVGRERGERRIENAWLPCGEVHPKESAAVMENSDASDYIRHEALCRVSEIISNARLNEVVLIIWRVAQV
jgi:hypothetical protein